jgi:AraC family ethanolamine operon transcriptional activator
VFIEYFGIGPLAYMHMRQVHQVHQALVRAEPDRTTVTSVAMRLGVWDLDALAARYRRVFGESPVSTLRKTLGHLSRRLPDESYGHSRSTEGRTR